MTLIQLELTPEQLLKAVSRLPQGDWERFIAQASAARPPNAERRLSRAESELLMKINQGIPADLQQRYDQLIDKREEMALTQNEHDELLSLSDQIELLDAQRVEYLSELAKLRKMPLTILMDDLGIQAPNDD